MSGIINSILKCEIRLESTLEPDSSLSVSVSPLFTVEFHLTFFALGAASSELELASLDSEVTPLSCLLEGIRQFVLSRDGVRSAPDLIPSQLRLSWGRFIPKQMQNIWAKKPIIIPYHTETSKQRDVAFAAIEPLFITLKDFLCIASGNIEK